MPAISLTAKVECPKCNKDLWLSSIAWDIKNCKNDDCWCRKAKGRSRLAYLTDQSPEDFLVPMCGKLVVSNEPEVVNAEPVHNHTPIPAGWAQNVPPDAKVVQDIDTGEWGYWHQGHWVPMNAYNDCY